MNYLFYKFRAVTLRNLDNKEKASTIQKYPSLNIFSKKKRIEGIFNYPFQGGIAIQSNNPIIYLQENYYLKDDAWDFDNCNWIKYFYKERTKEELEQLHKLMEDLKNTTAPGGEGRIYYSKLEKLINFLEEKPTI